MPLTDKGRQIMSAMKEKYGEERGERIFYASKNAGKITGVDQAPARDMSTERKRAFVSLFWDWLNEEMEEPEHGAASPQSTDALPQPATERRPRSSGVGPGGVAPMSNDDQPVRHPSRDWGSPRQPPAPDNRTLGSNGHGSWRSPRFPGSHDTGQGGWASPRFPGAPDCGSPHEGYDAGFPGTGPATLPTAPPNGGMRNGPSNGAPMQIIFSPDALVGGLKLSTGSLLPPAPKPSGFGPRQPPFGPRGRDAGAGATEIGSEPIRTPTLKPPDAKPEPLEPARYTTAPTARRDSTTRDQSNWRSPPQPQSYDAGTAEGARKAAATRASHGGSGQSPEQQHNAAHAYHKAQNIAGKSEHGLPAALHQHARMMHASPNPSIRAKAPAASQKAWAASAAVGHHPPGTKASHDALIGKRASLLRHRT